MPRDPKISVITPYFHDGLVDAQVANLSKWCPEIHLWALDEPRPSVAAYTRGKGAVGKFEVINRLLPLVMGSDLVLFVDDDVAFAPDFLPTYATIVAELGADLAQPALTADSYHSYPVTVERKGAWARTTNFVEVGPVVSMSRAFLDLVSPFPESNPMGWGLEAHWQKVAYDRGMTMAIVDACPVEHRVRPIAQRYLIQDAAAHMEQFLAENDLDWSPAEHRVEREYLRIYGDRDAYLDAFPAPREAVEHGHATDSAFDLELLWAVAALVRPGLIVELGTRAGVSTRTLAHAAKAWSGLVLTVDPADSRPYLEGVACEFLEITGETLYDVSNLQPRLLYVDTDPHSYRQTRYWLDTWVAHRIPEGGVAVFHDVRETREGIRVAQAVRDWLREHPRGWRWQEFPGTSGIGLLWHVGERPDFEGRVTHSLARRKRRAEPVRA